METNISTTPWKQAILHVDGDAFFASCEQLRDRTLRGKPVVVGRERGIAVALSYEAKKLGVTRGMPVFLIKKNFPEIYIVSSHYDFYSRISGHMIALVKRYTPLVEEASIDECYADITLSEECDEATYAERAFAIQGALNSEIGISFSVGLGTTRIRAKLASGLKKPSGCVVIPNISMPPCFAHIPLSSVCGIGSATAYFLKGQGIETVQDFVSKDEEWVVRMCDRPCQTLYYELRGKSLLKLSYGITIPKSIQRTRMISPPSSSQSVLLRELTEHIESVCTKARRYSLRAEHCSIFLRNKDYSISYALLTPPSPSNIPLSFTKNLQGVLASIYRKGTLYRGSGVTLSKFLTQTNQQALFDVPSPTSALEDVFESIDKVNERHGDRTIFLLGSYDPLEKDARRDTNTHLYTWGSDERMRLRRKSFSIPHLGCI